MVDVKAVKVELIAIAIILFSIALCILGGYFASAGLILGAFGLLLCIVAGVTNPDEKKEKDDKTEESSDK